MYLWNGLQVSRRDAGPNLEAEAKEPLVHMHQALAADGVEGDAWWSWLRPDRWQGTERHLGGPAVTHEPVQKFFSVLTTGITNSGDTQ